MKKVAVIQSSYIPWKGYFDIIHDVDEFIFYDEVLDSKGSWRTRNKIRVAQDPMWLTIPTGFSSTLRIDEILLPNPRWQEKHLKTLLINYSKAPYLKKYEEFLKHLYLEKRWERLSEMNQYMIQTISRECLGIQTKFSNSIDYPSSGASHEKLLSLVKATKADVYVSGPAAKSYIIAEDYAQAGIILVWKDYSGYPPYPQPFEPFIHEVSILDLLFYTGDDAPYYIWGFREEASHAK